MRAILIDPITRTITEPELTGPTLRALYTGLACEAVDRVRFDWRHDMWIDDEGRLKYPHPYGYFRIGGETFCGRGLVLAHDATGETVAATLPLSVIARVVEFIGTPSESEVTPSIVVTSWDD